MVSPAYKACPTFVSSLQATCQLSRSCTTLTSSNGFSVCFSLSMPSCLFPLRFFHSLPLFLLLTLSFAGFPIADEVILISKRQTVAIGVDALGALCYTLTRIFMQMNQFIRTRVIRTLVGADLSASLDIPLSRLCSKC